MLLLAVGGAHAKERPAALTARLQAIVDALRTQLAIPQPVTITVVAKNPLMASVEPAKAGDGFVLSIEESFATRLNDQELEGVIAHELGHVWIFTHHPYLQTEQLANRIAMRAVSRDSLARVYDKVWKDGVKGDLIGFLGVAAPQHTPTATEASTSAKAPAPTKDAEGAIIRK